MIEQLQHRTQRWQTGGHRGRKVLQQTRQDTPGIERHAVTHGRSDALYSRQRGVDALGRLRLKHDREQGVFERWQ